MAPLSSVQSPFGHRKPSAALASRATANSFPAYGNFLPLDGVQPLSSLPQLAEYLSDEGLLLECMASSLTINDAELRV